MSTTTVDTKTYIKETVQKLKSIQLPECTKGDFHEQLGQICFDQRCDPSKQFHAICAGCIEEKTHAPNINNHNERQLKRVLLEIAYEAQKDLLVTQNMTKIEKSLSDLSQEYTDLGNQCLQIAQSFNDSIKALRSKAEEENIVKNKILDQLNNIMSKTCDENDIQIQLTKLKTFCLLKDEKILIDNQKFEKDWQQYTNELNQRISSGQNLQTKIMNTKLHSFLDDDKQNYKSETGGQSPFKDSNGSGSRTDSEMGRTSSQIEKSKIQQFSELFKASSIQITNGKIAKQLESQSKEQRVALIEPEISKTKKTFFAFQVIQQTGWMGIGICVKDVVLKNNYAFSYQDIDHGQFLISSNGYKWVHENDNESGQQITFGFSQYDILLGEFDPILRRLRFKKKGSDRMASIQLEASYGEDEQLSLCVNITDKNDAIGLFVEAEKSN